MTDETLPDETGVEADEEAEAATAEVTEPEVQEEETKEPKGVQKRLNELTRLRYEAEEREREARQRLEKLEAQLQKPQQSDDRPKEDDFDSYEDYIAELGRWSAREEFKELKTKDQQEQEAKSQAEQEREFVKRAAEAREKYTDFDIASRQAVLSDAMQNVIIASEKGPDLLYYLGSHVDESYRIAQLDPYRAAAELGKLEVTLTSQPRSTNAPKPIPKVGSKEDVPTELSDDLPMDEWAARWRQKHG
jgi:hypothetical protein